jgi:DNA ligase 1
MPFAMPRMTKRWGTTPAWWAFATCWLILWAPIALARDDAPKLLLANVIGPHINVSEYLVSEKFDGVRALWDGRVLRFRSGREVMAPKWFLERLPTRPLDGELWMGRGEFDQLSGAVRKDVPVDDDWRRITYMVFELPGAPGSFAERYAEMQRVTAGANWPQLQTVAQSRVGNRAELKALLDRTVKAGGEGLMLHLANAPYVTGRSDVLIKVKALLDAEATVIAHVPGRGKYKGMMGALQLRTADGIEFKLGTGFTDAVRKTPPAVGSKVTYTYRDTTKTGKPRFASYLRARVEH